MYMQSLGLMDEVCVPLYLRNIYLILTIIRYSSISFREVVYQKFMK
jgi:hypothetical protein